MKLNKLILVAIVIASLVVISGSANNSSEKVDLQKGLVAYWSFDEGEGDIVFDESGNHNDGVLKCTGEDCSPSKWTEGKKGYALEFDGEDDYILVHHNDTLNFGSEPFTLAVWVYPDKDLRSTGLIIGKMKRWGSDTPHYFLKTWYLSSPKEKAGLAFSFQATDEMYKNRKIVNSYGNNYQWHHVVVIRDDQGLLKMFVDGVKTDTESKLLKNVDNTQSLTIGQRSVIHPGYFFQGMFDEVRIYQRSLTQNEIKQLYELNNQ